MKSIFSRITHHASRITLMMCLFMSSFILPNDVLSQNNVVTFASYPNMPIAQVNVVFHFLNNPGPGASDNFTQVQAENLAAILLTNANANFAAMQPCNRLGPNNSQNPHIPDAKIRFVSYGQSVFLYNHTNENMISKPYGNKVVNIVLTSSNPTCQNIGDKNAGLIRLCNITPSILDNSNPESVIQQTKRARLLCHELGHVLGLEHTHEGDNVCEGIDISRANETANGRGNNIMSYGGDPPSTDPNNWNNAITPCQWGKMYDYIFNGDANGVPQYIVWQSCNDYSDLSIHSGQVVIWNTPRIITQNIIVRTGGYLKIETTVKMGGSCVITVERGAKLVILGGKITKLCDEKWGGIYVWGNSNLEQPDPSPDPFSMQPSNQAGILYMGHSAVLEYAYNAMSNSRRDDGSVQWSDLIQYRGGVITADKCIFRFNQRCAEFIKYRKPSALLKGADKSKFENGCVFSDSYWGVTAWDVNLEFNECHFLNNNEALLGWDASINILNGCNVSNNIYGINLYSTSFTSYESFIGKKGLTSNTFDKNRYTIKSYAYGGAQGLKIRSNKINVNYIDIATGNIPPAQYGIYVESPTKLNIYDNIFDGKFIYGTYGMELKNTGTDANKIKCNKFNNLTIGISVEKNNSKTQFLKNEFYNSSIRDIVTPNLTFPTTINTTQGSSSEAAGNEFSNPNTVLAIGSTQAQFEYFIANNVPVSSNKVPKCNLTINAPTCSLPFQTYTNTWNSSPVEANCDTPDFTGDDEGDEVVYLELQVEVENLELNFAQNNRTDRNALSVLVEKKEKKERVLNSLLRKSMEDRNGDLAKRILKREKDINLKKKEIMVYFHLKDWREAKQFLNTLPNNTESIRNFKSVQNINLDRFQSNTKFRLSSNQKQLLESIANGEDTDNSGNAKSILSLLEGMRFDERLNGFNGSGIVEMRASGATKQVEKPITISPNPANQKVVIGIPEQHDIRTILFYDINGAIAKTVIAASVLFETDLTDCHGGLYIVKFLDSDNIVKHTAKLFVNK